MVDITSDKSIDNSNDLVMVYDIICNLWVIDAWVRVTNQPIPTYNLGLPHCSGTSNQATPPSIRSPASDLQPATSNGDPWETTIAVFVIPEYG